MNQVDKQYSFATANLAFLQLAVVGSLIGLGALLELVGVSLAFKAMYTTGGWCLLVNMIGLLPIWLLGRHDARGMLQGFMLSVFLRMVLSAIGVIVLGFKTSLGIVPVGLWMAGWYLVLLAVELTIIVKALDRMNSSQSQTSQTTTVAESCTC